MLKSQAIVLPFTHLLTDGCMDVDVHNVHNILKRRLASLAALGAPCYISLGDISRVNLRLGISKRDGEMARSQVRKPGASMFRTHQFSTTPMPTSKELKLSWRIFRKTPDHTTGAVQP